MNRSLITAWLFAAVLVPASVLAAGTGSSSTPSRQPSEYDQAVSAVNSGKYDRALQLLEKLVQSEPGNANAWNYLGFSHRKLEHYDSALAAYGKALKIDPRHRGAHEYLGELYLMTGDIAKAEEQLRKLDDLCFFGCSEYDELKAAIAKQKQKG